MTLSRTYFTPLPIKRLRNLQAVASSADSPRSITGELMRPDAPTTTTTCSSRVADLTIAAGLLGRKLTRREQVEMHNEGALDLALEDTFPASDPVSITFAPDSPTFPIVKITHDGEAVVASYLIDKVGYLYVETN